MISIDDAKKIFLDNNKNEEIAGCVLVEGFGYNFSTKKPHYDGTEKIVDENGKYYEIVVGFNDDNHPFNKAKKTEIIPLNF